MQPNTRAMNYFVQTDKVWPSPAQRRRRKHKLGHLAALERKHGYTHGLTK